MYKVRIVEVTSDDLLQPLIDYYREHDEDIYLSLRKEKLRNNYNTFRSVMENGGCENVEQTIKKLMKHEKTIEVEMDIDGETLFLFDDEGGDEEYLYNHELDMYVNTSCRVSVSPNNYGANELIFFSYLKIVGKGSIV